jgi:DNA-binding LytR/AlgR family response regulator
MLQLAICDDNINDLSNIVQLINQYRASRNVSFQYAVFSNGVDLVSELEQGKRYDMYCLDIILPGISGIDAAREIRRFDKAASIIFLSSSPEFALESYSVKAINYVLKPVTEERLFSAFDEVLDQIKAENEQAIIVKSHEGIQRILISNLVFAEVIGRYVEYHLLSGKVISCKEAFTAVCSNLLKYGQFIKPHRAFIVNMRYIDTIRNNQITLQTLSSIPIAQGKAREIKQQYLEYQMEAK